MRWLNRPLIMLGHGIRAAGCADLAPMLLELGLPVASSWLGKDLVDNRHPNFLGCTGIYGNRAANLAFSKADQIIAIGNRLCVWNVDNGLDHKPEVLMVDVDSAEAARVGATILHHDISYVIRQVLEPVDRHEWLDQCKVWNRFYPWLEYKNTEGYLNSYLFTDALQKYLYPDEVIVTDMGAPLMSAFQVLQTKPPQRLMTSGGLGEMGCGLPAAIGACFAGAKHVLCLNSDGSMMLNLQELQTIAHHKLPIKIIVYDNKGYLMIKHTQRNAGMPFSAINAETGVSFPDYSEIAYAFDLSCWSMQVKTWKDFNEFIPEFLEGPEPSLLVYHMDPNQPLVPRLLPLPDGSKPRFDQMSPLL